ncbi:MAG: DNA polymerase IV [Patescibacteria group bacterium]
MFRGSDITRAWPQDTPILFHVDMNSFFASCEQQANPFLRGKPIAVAGQPGSRTVIATASREAKARGVKTAMRLGEAKKICPELIFVPNDPKKYLWIHQQMMQIFALLTDQMEVWSIDEACLDVTKYVQRYGGIFATAEWIRMQLRKRLGSSLTCSIGIGPNKLLAKLGSDLDPGDGIFVFHPQDIPQIMAKIPLNKICGIGPRTEAKLREMRINSIPELAVAPVDQLVARFGKIGFWLHEIAHGRDSSDVQSVLDVNPNQSMGHSVTLPHDITHAEDIRRVLLKLSEKTARRLRAAHSCGRVVSAGIRYHNFTHFHAQCTLNHPTDDGYQIFQHAWEIVRRHHHPHPIRLLHVSVSDLHAFHQPSLFPRDRKIEQFTQTLDTINNRFGHWTIQRATLLPVRNIVREGSGYGLMKKFN